MLNDAVRYTVGRLLQIPKEKSLTPEELDWLGFTRPR
jgi:hypothetical protein